MGTTPCGEAMSATPTLPPTVQRNPSTLGCVALGDRYVVCPTLWVHLARRSVQYFKTSTRRLVCITEQSSTGIGLLSEAISDLACMQVAIRMPRSSRHQHASALTGSKSAMCTSHAASLLCLSRYKHSTSSLDVCCVLQVMDLVSQYNVSLYLNGHDHTGTHADPNHAGEQRHIESGVEMCRHITGFQTHVPAWLPARLHNNNSGLLCAQA